MKMCTQNLCNTNTLRASRINIDIDITSVFYKMKLRPKAKLLEISNSKHPNVKKLY